MKGALAEGFQPSQLIRYGFPQAWHEWFRTTWAKSLRKPFSVNVWCEGVDEGIAAR